MKLLTKKIERSLPSIYSNSKTAYVKFFAPWTNWTWWGAEYDPVNREFFGVVKGFETEWGYFSLDELESIRGPLGLRIERDMHFVPTKMEDILAMED